MSDEQRALREKQRIDDLRALMAEPAGRRFAWRLLGSTGIFQQSFVPGEPRIETTFFNEGKRSIGLELLAEINKHCPAQYHLMVQEASK